jgi:hypothetical protein
MSLMAEYARPALELERLAPDTTPLRLLAFTNRDKHQPRLEKRSDMPKASMRQRYYTLSDAVLEQRARQGDPAAQMVLEDRSAVRQMCAKAAGASSSRDYGCYLTQEIRLRFHRSRGKTGLVQMFLDIGEVTSLEAIKQQWEEIRTWQDLLLEWQGPSLSGRNGLFYQLHQYHRQGLSYAAIAIHLNVGLATALETYVNGNDELRQAISSRMIQTVHDLIQWQQATQSDTSELDFVQLALQHYGFEDNEIQEWCLGILENSVLRPYPFPRVVLFTRDWVIGKLRSWRAKNQLWLTTVDKPSHRTPTT